MYFFFKLSFLKRFREKCLKLFSLSIFAPLIVVIENNTIKKDRESRLLGRMAR